jgi:DNA-binding transcriptional MerR regulator
MKPGNDGLWTIEELAAEVAAALSVGSEGAPNGRVREIPDLRTIRYYTTLGLLDRPAEMRGRTALYSRRHLLQLAAIKRLQSRGLALAEIQERLLGLNNAALARLASLPDQTRSKPDPRRRSQRAFWREVAEPLAEREPVDLAPRLQFDPTAASSAIARGAGQPLETATGNLQALTGVPVHDGVTLLVSSLRTIDEDDLRAIRAAAGPLIKLLQTRRLIGPRAERSGDEPGTTPLG